MSLSDRAVIVTGGAGGVGLRVSERWLAAGALVLVVASRQESVDTALSKLGKNLHLYGLAADLTTESGAAQMSAAADAAFGRPADTLLHLVGGFAMGAIEAPEAPEVWDKMMSQNLDSAFHCYRAAISGFRALGRGWIVGLASRTAIQPPARLAAYAASKAGLIALSRSLAAETLSAGIHINVIVTSTVDTLANRAAMGEKHVGDWVTADDIADTTLYLCSDQARSISGATVEVYGKT